MFIRDGLIFLKTYTHISAYIVIPQNIAKGVKNTILKPIDGELEP